MISSIRGRSLSLLPSSGSEVDEYMDFDKSVNRTVQSFNTTLAKVFLSICESKLYIYTSMQACFRPLMYNDRDSCGRAIYYKQNSVKWGLCVSTTYASSWDFHRHVDGPPISKAVSRKLNPKDVWTFLWVSLACRFHENSFHLFEVFL